MSACTLFPHGWYGMYIYMDCSLPGFSVYGILQARILEWVSMPSSKVSSQLRDWTHVSCVFCITGGFLTAEPPGKPHIYVCVCICVCVCVCMYIPGGSDGKESACNAGDPGSIPWVRQDPLENGMATHSSILTWRVPWTEEPGGLLSTGLQRDAHDWAAIAHPELTYSI